MADTSQSLLERLREQDGAADWERLVAIYTPLIRNWLARHAASQETDDLVQEVLAVVTRRLRDFEHNRRTGAFRAWLKTITVNCLRDSWKKRRVPAPGGTDFQGLIQQLEDPNSGLSRQWDLEHDRHVMKQLQKMLQDSFNPVTWEAFHRVVVQQQPAEQAARDLGLTVNAVYIAKSRVLSRLRKEAQGLVDVEGEA